MARKPVSVFKRPMSKKGRYRYYIQLWDQALGACSTPRSAASIIQELDLDPDEYPSTSRTGALLIGQKLLARGKAHTNRSEILFADFCAEFWDWNSSSYIKGKQARGQRIGKEYVDHNAAYVRNYLRPAFPSLKLGDVRAFMLEEFVLRTKGKSGLGNSSLNAILNAASIPLQKQHDSASSLPIFASNGSVCDGRTLPSVWDQPIDRVFDPKTL
jgi:hypothetical protein